MAREIRRQRDEDSLLTADDGDSLYDDAMSDIGCSGGELAGIKKPISNEMRSLELPPRLFTEPFSLTTCNPRPQRCPSCDHGDMDLIFDARGVVLLGNGQQIGVDVNRLQCASCNATSPYEGFDDYVVVMERREIGDTTTLIILDEHWTAELMRNVHLSKDSFTDIYARLLSNAALLRPAADTTSASSLQSSQLIDISKTKLIQYIWQAMTHLYPVPPSALSCVTCGPKPDSVAFDGVAIGLLNSLLTLTRYHSVQRDQLTFPKVSRSLFLVVAMTHHCVLFHLLTI